MPWESNWTATSLLLWPPAASPSNFESTRTLEELTALQKAVDVADQAMESVCPTITEGMTEKEVAWRLEVAMAGTGSGGP